MPKKQLDSSHKLRNRKLSNISTRSSPKMADALLNPSDMDALVKKITSEVLAGVDKALENKIDPVLENLSAVATHVEQVENRVTEAETRISVVEDTVSRDNVDLYEMEKKARRGPGKNRRPGKQEQAMQYSNNWPTRRGGGD